MYPTGSELLLLGGSTLMSEGWNAVTFVVEDGTGLPNANAYVTVVYADAYHSDRGNATWTGSTAARQTAIIKATDYIDKRFGKRFRGERQQKDQNLEWPRLGAYDDDGFPLDGVDQLPRNLQKACAEYALKALVLGDLLPDPSETVGGALTMRRDKVGPLEEERQYGREGGNSGRDPVSGLVSTPNVPEYPAADLLMQELIKSFNSRRIVRG